MIVAVASRKASPGATTLTALLAAHWTAPSATRLIVEADPAGGSLAARWHHAHGLTWDPGLMTLSTTRRELAPDTVESVGQRLIDSVFVVAAPPAPDRVAAALHRFGDRGAAALAAAPDLVSLVDCGRLTATSPAMTLARRAALTILVCRPRLDEIHALRPGVAELSAAGCNLALVCIGNDPYPPAEVSDTLGVTLLGCLPTDTRAASELDRDGLLAGRVFRRSRLARTAEELAGLVRARMIDAVDGVTPLASSRRGGP